MGHDQPAGTTSVRDGRAHGAARVFYVVVGVGRSSTDSASLIRLRWVRMDSRTVSSPSDSSVYATSFQNSIGILLPALKPIAVFLSGAAHERQVWPLLGTRPESRT